MKIPSFPADDVQKAVAVIGEDSGGLLQIVQELRGLANDAKPIISLFNKFKDGYSMGQEKGKSQAATPQIAARAAAPAATGAPVSYGLTAEEIHIIVRDDIRQVILYYLDMAIKTGYGDKTVAELVPTINIKLKDIRAMLAM